MARKSDAADAIDDIESSLERAAGWLQVHWRVVTTALAVFLLSVLGVAQYLEWQSNREEAASSALEEMRSAYLLAVGAPPDGLDIPEPADPEAAQKIREAYAELFREVAEKHPGTVAGTLARLEFGNLVEASGDGTRSLEIWQQTLSDTPRDSALRGIVLERIAQGHEDAGRWAEAAEVHQAAGEIESFPLRHWALVDAARCFDQAGQPERSLDLLERVEAEAPDLQLPDHLRTRLRELHARAPR